MKSIMSTATINTEGCGARSGEGIIRLQIFFLLLHVGNRPVGWERKRIERQGKREEEGGGRQRGRSVRDRERVERTRKEKGG